MKLGDEMNVKLNKNMTTYNVIDVLMNVRL